MFIAKYCIGNSGGGFYKALDNSIEGEMRRPLYSSYYSEVQNPHYLGRKSTRRKANRMVTDISESSDRSSYHLESFTIPHLKEKDLLQSRDSSETSKSHRDMKSRQHEEVSPGLLFSSFSFDDSIYDQSRDSFETPKNRHSRLETTKATTTYADDMQLKSKQSQEVSPGLLFSSFSFDDSIYNQSRESFETPKNRYSRLETTKAKTTYAGDMQSKLKPIQEINPSLSHSSFSFDDSIYNQSRDAYDPPQNRRTQIEVTKTTTAYDRDMQSKSRQIQKVSPDLSHLSYSFDDSIYQKSRYGYDAPQSRHPQNEITETKPEHGSKMYQSSGYSEEVSPGLSHLSYSFDDSIYQKSRDAYEAPQNRSSRTKTTKMTPEYVRNVNRNVHPNSVHIQEVSPWLDLRQDPIQVLYESRDGVCFAGNQTPFRQLHQERDIRMYISPSTVDSQYRSVDTWDNEEFSQWSIPHTESPLYMRKQKAKKVGQSPVEKNVITVTPSPKNVPIFRQFNDERNATTKSMERRKTVRFSPEQEVWVEAPRNHSASTHLSYVPQRAIRRDTSCKGDDFLSENYAQPYQRSCLPKNILRCSNSRKGNRHSMMKSNQTRRDFSTPRIVSPRLPQPTLIQERMYV